MDLAALLDLRAYRKGDNGSSPALAHPPLRTSQRPSPAKFVKHAHPDPQTPQSPASPASKKHKSSSLYTSYTSYVKRPKSPGRLVKIGTLASRLYHFVHGSFQGRNVDFRSQHPLRNLLHPPAVFLPATSCTNGHASCRSYLRARRGIRGPLPYRIMLRYERKSRYRRTAKQRRSLPRLRSSTSRLYSSCCTPLASRQLAACDSQFATCGSQSASPKTQ